jgi:hypothetical protein
MAYGSVRSDFLVYSTITGDVTLSVSGINDSTVLAGIVNGVTKDITTTGIISGALYKISGNITIIDQSGNVRPYNAYSFPTTTGASGSILSTNGDGTTSWIISPTWVTVGTTVALN